MPTGTDLAATQIKLVSAALLLILSFILGYWLNKMGKPYHIALLTSHKLISLALFVLLCIVVYRFSQIHEFNAVVTSLCVITGLLFLGSLVSGGLLSTDLALPSFLKITHHITPYLAVLFSGITLYLIISPK
jgi:hypothetical protein